jgi:hypothetical protein
MKLRIYNKNGELARYGLVCGYVQKYKSGGQELSLWFEGNTFHVREFSHNEGKRVVGENFDKLSEARKFYNGRKAQIKKLHK